MFGSGIIGSVIVNLRFEGVRKDDGSQAVEPGV